MIGPLAGVARPGECDARLGPLLRRDAWLHCTGRLAGCIPLSRPKTVLSLSGVLRRADTPTRRRALGGRGFVAAELQAAAACRQACRCDAPRCDAPRCGLVRPVLVCRHRVPVRRSGPDDASDHSAAPWQLIVRASRRRSVRTMHCCAVRRVHHAANASGKAAALKAFPCLCPRERINTATTILRAALGVTSYPASLAVHLAGSNTPRMATHTHIRGNVGPVSLRSAH